MHVLTPGEPKIQMSNARWLLGYVPKLGMAQQHPPRHILWVESPSIFKSMYIDTSVQFITIPNSSSHSTANPARTASANLIWRTGLLRMCTYFMFQALKQTISLAKFTAQPRASALSVLTSVFCPLLLILRPSRFGHRKTHPPCAACHASQPSSSSKFSELVTSKMQYILLQQIASFERCG